MTCDTSNFETPIHPVGFEFKAGILSGPTIRPSTQILEQRRSFHILKAKIAGRTQANATGPMMCRFAPKSLPSVPCTGRIMVKITERHRSHATGTMTNA